MNAQMHFTMLEFRSRALAEAVKVLDIAAALVGEDPKARSGELLIEADRLMAWAHEATTKAAPPIPADPTLTHNGVNH